MSTKFRCALWSTLASAALSLTASGIPFQFQTPFSPQSAGTTAGDGGPEAPGSPRAVEGLNTGPQANFWRRDTMTGDWNDFRNQLLYKGISLTPVYQGEVFGNSGGADQGVIYDGVFNVALDLDLERLTGFWHDAVIHTNALYIHGNSLSSKYVGDFSNTSNLSGYNSIRLQELWLEQSLWDKRISIRAGLLAADTEFFTSDSAGLFINGTFGAFTLIGANFTNAPIYPVGSPGIRLSFQPVSKAYFKAAIFGMDSFSDPAENNQHGTHFHINDSDGALLMFELGYLVNQSPNDRGLVGTYKLGTFFQRGNYPSFDSQADEALGTGSNSGKGTNYAVYLVGDQEIYKSAGRIVTAFVRAGFAPARLSFVDAYVDAGFNFTGFLPGRVQDVAGLAYAYSKVSDDFSDADQRQGNTFSTGEGVIEATYRANITPWWSLQPDIQYVINPSGAAHSTDAFVFGLRTTVLF